MARPKKQTVDYFPHYVNGGKTLFIIEKNFGNDGYAFWFKILELLGSTNGHVIDSRNPGEWEFLLAKTLVSDSLAREMLDLLAKLNAIDLELWNLGIIWGTNFVENIADVYKNRKVGMPKKPEKSSFYEQKLEQDIVSTSRNPESLEFSTKTTNINSQSKVKQSKVNKNKENNTMSDKSDDVISYSEILDYLNEKTGKKFSKKADANKKLIKARWNEGFRLNDFKKVIDNMVSNWSGVTFSNGQLGDNYLQPKTLFGNKFDSYLNQTSNPTNGFGGKIVKSAPKWASNGKPPEEEELTPEEAEAFFNGY